MARPVSNRVNFAQLRMFASEVRKRPVSHHSDTTRAMLGLIGAARGSFAGTILWRFRGSKRYGTNSDRLQLSRRVIGVSRMRRWPSIVPDTADRDVYLVLEDFGRLGGCWRETDEERTDRATVVQDLFEASTTVRSAWWLSTQQRVGHGTFQKTLPTNCCSASPLRMTLRPNFKTSLIGLAAAGRCSCRFLCGARAN